MYTAFCTSHFTFVLIALSYLVGHNDKFLALNELLERHSDSAYYKDGISYSLLKVAELGLVPAAEILLQYGADLSFEGKYSNPP